VISWNPKSKKEVESVRSMRRRDEAQGQTLSKTAATMTGDQSMSTVEHLPRRNEIYEAETRIKPPSGRTSIVMSSNFEIRPSPYASGRRPKKKRIAEVTAQNKEECGSVRPPQHSFFNSAWSSLIH